MDNVTHTLFALTLARTGLGSSGRGTTVALVLASNAPDIDIVATFGGGANYLAWHRGPTHGPLGVVGLAVLTAALVWSGRRALDSMRADPTATNDAPFARLILISMLGVLLHVFMDVPTSYGTRLLSPFSWRWYAIDLMPIIDIYLLIVLAGGLVLGSRSRELARRSAAIVLVLMAINYGVRAFAHGQALKLTERLVLADRVRPPECDAQAPSRSLVSAWPLAIGRTGSCLIQMAAIPSFGSPLAWRVIAQFSDAYQIYEIDLRDSGLRLDPDAIMPDSPLIDRLPSPVTLPNQWTPAVVEAARARTARILLGFSRFPLVRATGSPSGIATVRFTDLRFNSGVEEDSPLQRRRSSLFAVTVRIGPDHEILQEQLGE